MAPTAKECFVTSALRVRSDVEEDVVLVQVCWEASDEVSILLRLRHLEVGVRLSRRVLGLQGKGGERLCVCVCVCVKTCVKC